MVEIAQPSIDVSIAAHYVPHRVPFLAEVIDSIAGWTRSSVRVRIVTNDLAIADEPLVAAAVEGLRAKGFELSFDRAHSMAHPWHLTWWHKTHLREWSQASGHPRDLFVYIEDDIAIPNAAIEYFDRYLPAAKAIGCIPGFIRYERGPDGRMMAIDFRGSQLVKAEAHRSIEGQAFVASAFPYWAGFIMDRELCAEYWDSPWSDLVTADTLPQSHKHSCRVQSAWALTYQSPPPGLPSRYVVPVDDQLRPLPECLVWHCANNYSRSKEHSFGTVAVDEAMLMPTLGARLRKRVWQSRALLRRAREKLRRERAKMHSATAALNLDRLT